MALKKIGILDFGLRKFPASSSKDLFDYIINEAVKADELGFSRLWYTEHFVNNAVWLSPDMLIPIVASYTERINIGIAGALLLYREPIYLASNFKLLSNIFPNRLDLGFAKGTANEPYQTFFPEFENVSYKDRKKNILKKVETTIDLFDNEEMHSKNGIILPPFLGVKPDLWNLVSSPAGLLDSLRLGINCSRTIMFENCDTSPGLPELEKYRDVYASQYGTLPKTNIVVTGTCQKNQSVLKTTKEETIFTLGGLVEDNMVIGTPEQVYLKLQNIAEKYNVEEIIFAERSTTFKQRLDSFKNLSEIFSLKN